MRYDAESVERLRLGYLCFCGEPFETPFPEKCVVCGREPRKTHAQEFAEKYRGVERDPRAQLIERELNALDDRHERNFYTTTSGIVVPRKV